MSRTTGFTPEIREQIRQGAIDSAAVITNLLFVEFAWMRRVVDVGCGEGWWTRAFGKIVGPLGGCALGVDYDVEDGDEPGVGFRHVDLRAPFSIEDGLGPFDVAVSLEVAEHLPPERAEGFVADLCALAPLVVFSAAIPGQGGTGHLNEQPPGYWAELFDRHGYHCSGYLRWRWGLWNDEQVEPWYRQNLLVAFGPSARRLYVERHRASRWADVEDDAPPRHVVHPVVFDARKA